MWVQVSQDIYVPTPRSTRWVPFPIQKAETTALGKHVGMEGVLRIFAFYSQTHKNVDCSRWWDITIVVRPFPMKSDHPPWVSPVYGGRAQDMLASRNEFFPTLPTGPLEGSMLDFCSSSLWCHDNSTVHCILCDDFRNRRSKKLADCRQPSSELSGMKGKSSPLNKLLAMEWAVCRW